MTGAVATCTTCATAIPPRTTRDGRPTRVPRYCSNACRQRAYRERVRDEQPARELPVPVDEFIGRKRELEELRPLLRAGRLLTLTGPVGAGKTRLALALAGRAARSGVAWVQLGSCTSEESVLHAVADAVDLGQGLGEAMPGLLAAAIGEQDRLLVLDNCEHVLAACGALVQALLARCPNLRILVTSRETLRLPGEVVYRVDGLPLPESGAQLAAASRADAIKLFVTRARAVAPDFGLTAATFAQVCEVCTRLEGMPLALELAAGLVRLLPVAEILARLNDQLALLTGGPRGTDVRHRSLRAAIESSYRLLSPAEQSAFRRLSLPPGGFGVDAAAALCQSDAAGPGEVIEVMASLEAKSLIIAVPQAGRARFRMVEAIRLYGLERLAAEGEEPECRERFTEWLAQLSLSLFDSVVLTSSGLSTVEDEFDNFVFAAGSPAGTGDERRLALLAAVECVRWELCTTGDEGAALTQALAETDTTSAYRPLALGQEARRALERGDRARARLLITEAVELERPRARPGLLGRLLRISGFVSNLDGDPAGAATVLAEAVEISRVLGDELGEVSSLQQLAWNLMEKGDLDGAERLQHAHLDRARRLGAHRQLSGGLHTSGCLALHRGDFDTAARHFAESIRVAPPYARFVTDCMAGLAVVATRAGRFDRALRLIAAARHLSPGIDAEPWWPVLVTPAENLARRALSSAATEAAVLAGAQLTVSQAITYALAGGKGRRPCPFSARERQVAGLITDGLTNRQISGRLTVSLRTVETVVANIRAKIGVPSRVQVALWVAEHRAGGCCGPTS